MPFPAIAALGGYASVLGIYSFFDDALNGDIANQRILGQLNDIGNRLTELETLVEANIEQELGDGIALTNTALADLQRFEITESADVRAQIIADVPRQANLALETLISDVRPIINDASSLDLLLLGYTSLHYGILARQLVSTTLESGPLGSPGLHNLVKRAANLLDDQDRSVNDLRWQIEDRIADGIQVGTGFSTVEVLAVSDNPNAVLTGLDQQWVANFLVTSEATNNEPGMDRAPGLLGDVYDADSLISAQLFGQGTIANDTGFNGIGEYWAHTETRAAFEARAAERADDLFAEMFARELQKEWYLDLVRMADEVHEYLGLGVEDITDFYEEPGTPGDDVLQGTGRADFILGREGDDALWGRRDSTAPDDPGGPDALDGGSGNDILRGSGLNDFLVGGPGSDIIIAADTIFEMGTNDVARFFGLYSDQAGAVSDYTVRGGADFALVIGPDGDRDKLFGVENLWFDNVVIELGAGNAYDEAGVDGQNPLDFVTAERVALLYEATLNRDGGIDLPGLNFYIDVTERDNLSDAFLAENLMTSPEFTEKFGDVTLMDNQEFLSRVYENILDRLPDDAGLAFYLDLLDTGQISRSFALANISLSNENVRESQAVLMGLYENSAGEWSFL